MVAIFGWLIAAFCFVLFVAFAFASTFIAVLSIRTPPDRSC